MALEQTCVREFCNPNYVKVGDVVETTEVVPFKFDS